MKLPFTLPWWAWLLTAAVVIFGFKRRTAQAAMPPAKPAALVGATGMFDPGSYRPRSKRDEYNTYLATTTAPTPLTFEEWMLLQTGEAKNSGDAVQLMS